MHLVLETKKYLDESSLKSNIELVMYEKVLGSLQIIYTKDVIDKYLNEYRQSIVFRLNSKNGCSKYLSNYGIVGVNKGLFTNDCKKALKYV